MNVWTQTYPIAEGNGLRVDQRSGEVLITGVPGRTDVKLTASSPSRTDFAEEIVVREQDNSLCVEVKRRGFFGWGGSPSLKLEFEVPVGTACTVDSGSGPVAVSSTAAAVWIDTGSGPVKVANVGATRIDTGSGLVQGCNINGAATAGTGSGPMEFDSVNGSIKLDTGSGSVVVRHVRGDVHIDTGSGPLQVEDVNGSADLDTGSGSVLVAGLRGASLSIDNGGGPVQLREIDVAELSAETGSGGVDVALVRLQAGGTYAVASGSGGVHVALPPAADVTVYAEAASGRVVRDGLDFRVIREERGELDAVLNGGQAELRVEAGSGGIRFSPYRGPGAAQNECLHVPPVPPLPVTPPQIMEAVKGDPALETSDQLRRIVQMVEQGKLTPQEAEELLRALDEEETA